MKLIFIFFCCLGVLSVPAPPSTELADIVKKRLLVKSNGFIKVFQHSNTVTGFKKNGEAYHFILKPDRVGFQAHINSKLDALKIQQKELQGRIAQTPSERELLKDLIKQNLKAIQNAKAEEYKFHDILVKGAAV